MVQKSYLRYNEGSQAGVLVSPQAMQVVAGMFRDKEGGASALFPALESVQMVRLKSGTVEMILSPADAKRSATCEVTSFLLFPRSLSVSTGCELAVGYANGHVALFSFDPHVLNGSPSCRWYALGHKPDHQVLALAVDSQKTLVASGSQDTDITIWDMSSSEPSYRLKGHRGAVVAVWFVPGRSDVVISGAADGWIKVWDLNVRQCVQTVVASDIQVTSLCLDEAGKRLYCGVRDNAINVYRLQLENESAAVLESLLVEHGQLARKTNKPIIGFKFSADGAFLLGWTSKTIEVFRTLSTEDIKKKLQRKKKRRRTEGGNDDIDEDDTIESTAGNASVSAVEATAAEEVKHLRTFFMEQKIRAVDFVPAASAKEKGSIQLIVSFNTNTAITYMTSVVESQVEGASILTMTDLVQRHQLSEFGHHGDIRQLNFVDEDSALMSVSHEGVRLWSVTVQNDGDEEVDDDTFFTRKEAGLSTTATRRALRCTGSLAVEQGVTCCAPATSELCCIGTEDGSVMLINVVASEVICTQSVHVGAIRSVAYRPCKSGFTSLGSDRRLVVWTLAVLQDKAQTVSLQLTHEIELNESPLFLEYSPDGKLAGVGLQDNNIQLFYADTMKPFLVLFGHKLPPTGIAFSTDGTLAASVGMDKSLRFWGTDFGDCHRAIHAHDDYVTAVRFVPETHYVFTCSMDGYVKYWDGDTWAMIQRFRFHQKGLWSLAVNSNGTCFASAGVDRCIRLGLRSEELLFLQEEEERMIQEAMDEDAARRAALQKLEDKNAEVAIAGQVTSSTTDAAENLMEALDLISVELQRKAAEGESYQAHMLFRNKTVWEYLWGIIDGIRPSELRHAVGSLTSTHVNALLEYLEKALEAGAVTNFETASKLILAVLSPPPGQTQGKAFLSVSGEGTDTNRCLHRLRVLIAQGLQRSVDRFDFNVAGLRFVMQQISQQDKVKFFDISKIQGHKKKYHSSAVNE